MARRQDRNVQRALSKGIGRRIVNIVGIYLQPLPILKLSPVKRLLLKSAFADWLWSKQARAELWVVIFLPAVSAAIVVTAISEKMALLAAVSAYIASFAVMPG